MSNDDSTSTFLQRAPVPGATSTVHFRNQFGIADAAIAQTSNAQLVFYGPSNEVGSNGFAWMSKEQDSSSNAIMTLSSDGNLDVYGDVTALHNSLSDQKYKVDITSFGAWREPLSALRPVEFTWDTTCPLPAKRGHKDIGLIAQEVAEAYPLAHDHRDVGHIVRLEKLVPLLIAATKGMQEEIDTLTARVNAISP